MFLRKVAPLILLGLLPCTPALSQCAKSWQPVSTGFDAEALCVAAARTGRFVVGGLFTTAGGTPANRIAEWTGSRWQALGAGMSGQFDRVSAVGVLRNGDIVAGGDFRTAGGTPALNIARWNGTSWASFGAGLNNRVFDFLELPNGHLIVAGAFTKSGTQTLNRVARWDGSAWHPLGAGFNFIVFDVERMPNGDLVAGGGFSKSGTTTLQRIARWNGFTWTGLSSGMSQGTGNFGGPHVSALHVLPNGHLIAAGGFLQAGATSVGSIARWDGTNWFPLGAGLHNRGTVGTSVLALTALPNGDIVAGGGITHSGSRLVGGVARWNGTSWSPASAGSVFGINDLAFSTDGKLIAVGEFPQIGQIQAQRVARLTPSCGPATTPYGSTPMCRGSNGPIILSGSEAWVGGTYAWQVTGMGRAPGALGVVLFGGASRNTPLSTVLPRAASGCRLLADPGFAQLVQPSGGNLAFTYPVPSDPWLATGTLFQQVISLEYSGSTLNLTSSSNGIQLKLGSF